MFIMPPATQQIPPSVILLLMNEKNKYIITFAGPVGSSKTPIANYISTNLNLPMYNNDAVRSEVIEDLLHFNEGEFRKRAKERINAIFAKGNSFIFDASIDRRWEYVSSLIKHYNYTYFIISMDFSQELLRKIYEAKGYHESFKTIERLLNEHQQFTERFGQEVGLSLKDKDFPNRLEISLSSVKQWIDSSV